MEYRVYLQQKQGSGGQARWGDRRTGAFGRSAGSVSYTHLLEDLGYYCVDNLPISLIPRFAEICLAATERYERVALVTDVRAGGDLSLIHI